MSDLKLTPAERAVVADVLDEYLSDLRMEIADTDSHDFRDRLKERRQVIEKVLEALRAD